MNHLFGKKRIAAVGTHQMIKFSSQYTFVTVKMEPNEFFRLDLFKKKQLC
jgi:hypothetical protein